MKISRNKDPALVQIPGRDTQEHGNNVDLTRDIQTANIRMVI
jgi:hypothetical protein